jgi:hypothetical protein
MSYMFIVASSFNQPLHWDTGNVKYELYVLRRKSFNQTFTWDTSNVENMSSMFHGALSFNQTLYLDLIRVEDKDKMFDILI